MSALILKLRPVAPALALPATCTAPNTAAPKTRITALAIGAMAASLAFSAGWAAAGLVLKAV